MSGAGAAPCLGLIVPPASGAVPSDGAVLYGERVRFIARGLGIAAISPEGFAPVVDRIVGHALALRDEGAQAISLMGTSLSFYRGAARTEALRAHMAEATGLPCTTMSHAVVAALRQLGVRRVAVATSYIDTLNERLESYLRDCGFIVTAIAGLSITGVEAVGQVSTEALVGLSERVWRQDPSAEGIFISCGGLLTLDAIRTLEDRLGVPVTASSPAGFWDLVRLSGDDASSPGFGRLFAR
ncbi:aspartate/glutamate racemase family protein [Ramlibacter sp. AN1015]|uniref:arylmalonate decarboxylase n=1 Tax=Ramlibacter sp. AN1015 TaxID=3133428 RepID=UPI0030C35E57